MSTQRDYDIILYGATGFTGQLTAEYLTRSGSHPFNWAIAGRNPQKLQKIIQGLQQISPANAPKAAIKADSSDPASLLEMARQAKVVITTVGPYIHYGQPLVKACTEAGTHYVDLTGEPEFVDWMSYEYHQQAQQKGVKIVNCCGFDSIPHDMGVFYTIQQLIAGMTEDQVAKSQVRISGVVKAGGTFSGGTWHSAIHAFSRASDYYKKKKLWSQRKPASDGRKVHPSPNKVYFEKKLNKWLCPFPTIDPQVVRRSAKLFKHYGGDFQYGHYISFNKFPKLAVSVGSVAALFALAQLKPTRNLLLKVKKPGDGPTPEQIKNGWFKVTMFASINGQEKTITISGGDPGYGDTAKMLAESALCLAQDAQRLPEHCGVVPPAAAMGEALLLRLQKNAGLKFEVVE